MFWLWRKLDDADRCRVWKYYGWFSGLMCLGCLTGLVSYAAWAVFLNNYYNSRSDFKSPSEFVSKSYVAVSVARTAAACCIAFMSGLQALRWLSVYAVMYPFTFCCVAVTKLLVIDRMMDFSKLKDANSSRWTFFGRALVWFVVVGNVVGLAGGVAASVFWSNAAAALEPVDGKGSRANVVLDVILRGAKAASIHIFIESIMLVLIVVAFGVVGAACARRMRAAMQAFRAAPLLPIRDVRNSITQSGDALASGRRLNRQITSTCFVVFFSFFIRAAYTTLFASSVFLQTIPTNAENRCPSNDFFNFLFIWLLYNPILFFSLILVSQPVALLVSLWGMTSSQMISLLRRN
jgi:hypothetical protein